MTAGRTVKTFDEGEIRTTSTWRGDRPEYLCRGCGPAKLKAWRKRGGRERVTRKSDAGYVTFRSGNQTIPNWILVSTLVPNRQVREYTSALLRMPSDSLLPGQPVPLPRGPTLQLGSGIYARNGETRASLFGTPLHHGSVGLSFHLCPVRFE